MKIINKKTDELIPYINNPRNNDCAVDAVASSIKNFGFKVPIIIDNNNEIIAGHTRLKAAKKLNISEVPCVVADDLTPAQIKAFRIADNKVSEAAEWDMELLAAELQDLDEFTGFTEEEIKDIFSEEDTEVKEVDTPEIPAKSITRSGDVWILGRHRLLCGDSTKAEDVAKLMNGYQADITLTDPPYNVDYEGGTGMKIQNDNMDDVKFYQFLFDAFTRMIEVSKPGAPIYIFHSDSEGHNFRKAMKDSGWALKQCLIWVKNSLVLGRQDYQWQHEPILYGWKEGAAHRWYGGRNKDTVIEDSVNFKKMSKKELQDLLMQLSEAREHTTIIKVDKPLKCDLHPTMKPLKLIAYLLKNSSRPGDLVVDLFGGSGSTLMTCEQLNRTCHTMELDNKYADVIIQRYIDFKGSTEEVILERRDERLTYEKAKQRS